MSILQILSIAVSLDAEFPALQNLRRILEKGTPTISIWGNRQIQYGKQTLSVNEIVRQTWKAGRQCRNQGLDELRRDQWIGVCNTIKPVYENTDALVKQCNFFTRFLVYVREFFMGSLPKHDLIELDETKADFSAYSESALALLEKAIGSIERKECGAILTREMKYITVSEQVIRKKAEIDLEAVSRQFN
jgi:hypothetical protein